MVARFYLCRISKYYIYSIGLSNKEMETYESQDSYRRCFDFTFL